MKILVDVDGPMNNSIFYLVIFWRDFDPSHAPLYYDCL